MHKQHHQKSKPVVLCFSGHCPTGGAGILADSEAIHAAGCHAISIITTLTQQDTHNLYHLKPVSNTFIKQQVKILLKDISISAVKIGLLADPLLVKWLGQFIQKLSVPIVLDPILWAGGGTKLNNKILINSICKYIIPFVTLVTPNQRELFALVSNTRSITKAANSLHQMGGKAVLVTGTDANKATQNIQHFLYEKDKKHRIYISQRLPLTYHGSGCTLSASIASHLACGNSLENAIQKAQRYTFKTLKNSFSIGSGQQIPNRTFFL